MDRIEVGDLVIVVKPGCSLINLGVIFKVSAIRQTISRCFFCSAIHGSGSFLIGDGLDGIGLAESRVKRIPPLTEPVAEHEEATA